MKEQLLNKSFMTNFIAVVIIIIGSASSIQFIKSIGFFCPIRGDYQLAGNLYAV